ncbi:MAG: low molecular weight phosphatase family protein [Candidatus Paceibacterota bacterium]
MDFLFICRGNVGRSQMAEGLFAKMTNGKYKVISAGTKLSGLEQTLRELPLAENLILCMQEEGIDVSNNIRRQLTEKMTSEASKIVLVIDESDPVPDYLRNNEKVTTWIVPDPKGTDLDFHRKIRDQIKERIEELVSGLK